MTRSTFEARLVGRQWQIWRDGEFFSLAWVRFPACRAAKNREEASAHAARCAQAEIDAAQWAETVRIHRLQAASAYLEKRKARPVNLSLSF